MKIFRRLSKKAKVVIAIVSFAVITPVLVYSATNIYQSFDTRSSAGEINNKCSLRAARNSTLSEYAKARDINVGTLLSECFSDSNQWQALCKKTVLDEYEDMMLSFQTSWKWTEREQGVYKYDDFDEMVAFAKANNLKLHYFHLIWFNADSISSRYSPEWLFPNANDCGDWTRDELLEIMENRIKETIKRGGDTVVAWNVVNEAFDNDQQTNNCFYKIIGPDYIDKAFEYAREATPDSLLVLNETFGSNANREKTDTLFTRVKTLKNRGVPIDAVGIQNHLTHSDGIQFKPEYLENFEYFLKKAKETGVKVLITEMDIYNAGHISSQVAQLYKDTMELCLDDSNCISFATWGVSDKQTWLRSERLGLSSEATPLLFNGKYERKDSYYSVMEALKENTIRPCTPETEEPIEPEEKEEPEEIESNAPNKTLWDSFKGGTLDADRWGTYTSSKDVTVKETTTNHLSITIPKGNNDGSVKYAGAILKKSIESDSDFTVSTTISKPTVVGYGKGISGISFNTSEVDEDQAIRVYWEVGNNSSKLIFTTKTSSGQTKEQGSVNVNATAVKLKLSRKGLTYTAKYQETGDDDNEVVTIGEVKDYELLTSGKVKLFANNVGVNNNFPGITSKIDNIGVSWYDENLSAKDEFT